MLIKTPLSVMLSVSHKYVGDNAGGGSHQDKSAAYQQPVVAGRRRVQAIAVPMMDNVSTVMTVVVSRHGVSRTEVPVARMPGI